jgi:hypothetical protein
MKNFRKIFVTWVSCLVLMVGSLFFPHSGAGALSLVNEGLRLLLLVLSVYLVFKEPIKKNKFIFLNFAGVFLFSIVNHLYNFVAQGSWSSHYYYQFEMIAHTIFLSLAIIYTVIDSLFRDFRTYQKYAIALIVVGGFSAWNYHSYFENPNYLYTTDDIRDWKVLDNARTAYLEGNRAEPNGEELAQLVTLHAWNDGSAVADLQSERNLERIQYLSKYLPEDNYLVLLWRPMHRSVIQMNVVCILFLFLFFGYQYKKDPPQGAYVDKIMFLFLLFCSMEALHALGYMNALEWNSTLVSVFVVGQYVTIGILLFMILFFSLRLRFITSVQGEFYESELVHNAKHITRWRDWVDNLVVRYFLDPKALRGRLLALRTDSGKEELADTHR